MTVFENTHLLALGLALALPACATLQSQEASDDAVQVALRIDLPQSIAPPKFDDAYLLEIADDGSLTFAGNPITAAEFRAKTWKPSAEGEYQFGVTPATYAPIEKVTDALSAIPQGDVYAFTNPASYRIIDRPKDQSGKVIAASYFVGDLGKYELPLSVAYLADSKQCLVAYDEFTVSGIELYERSFDRLDRIVQNNGGAEAVLGRASIIDNIIARVQSTADTPWRCVAGAIYHAQSAGWPVAQIEFVKRK